MQKDCRVWAGLGQRGTHMWFYPGQVLLMLSNSVLAKQKALGIRDLSVSSISHLLKGLTHYVQSVELW